MNTSDDRPSSRFPFLLLQALVFFFISGACGLLYQVVWTRKLVLLFGATSHAVSTVLAIFFLGLGIGSLLGGRLADRRTNPLFLYGVFEVIIGLWALLFLVVIDDGGVVVVSVLRLLGESHVLGLVFRGLLAVVLLIVPVTLMGATLPLLAKYVTTRDVKGMPIGALYTVNTLGAVLGCSVTGFVLLARFGYVRTSLFGVAANVVIGIVAMIVSRRQSAPVAVEKVKESDVSGEKLSGWLFVLAIVAFGLTGFCMLGLEVLWTRLLVLVFKGTTYAFTTMLTSLLCGIVLGSGVASCVVDKVRNRSLVFGVLVTLLGLSCLYTVKQFAGIPESYIEMSRASGFDWGKLVWVNFRASFIILLIPTFLSGAIFPFAVKTIAVHRASLGRDVGRLYGANTFGGVVGSLAGGFLILPAIGTHGGIVLLGSVLFGAGMLFLLLVPGLCIIRRAALLMVGAALCVTVFAVMPGNVDQLLSKVYLPEAQEVIHYREGVEGTVLVTQPVDSGGEGDRVLWINAMQATAAIDKGVKMNRFQGMLPHVFDREPERCLFMCFGSGITAGTLGLFDFDRIDAVELSPDILEAAHFFSDVNFNVMENEKLRFIVDDGRNYLLTTDEHYDLITFEPMPLAQAGVSTFYTREYYELCLEHLTPGGLVSQWVPLHGLDTDIVRSLVKTFVDVFPECTCWFVNADLFLIGSNAPLVIDYPRALERLERPEVLAGLSDVYLGDVTEFLASFLMSGENLRQFAEGGDIMTDDRPWAEFKAPKLMFESHVDDGLKALLPLYEGPGELVSYAGMDAASAAEARAALERRVSAHRNDFEALINFYGGMVLSGPEKGFIDSLRIDPNDLNAQYYLLTICDMLVERYIKWQEPEKAVELLGRALEVAPDLPGLSTLMESVQAQQ